MPGPPPKRSSERRRRNKDENPTTKIKAGVAPVVIPAEDSSWHPIAKHWWRSLKVSPQHAYFQASDWAAARLTAETMSRMLRAERLSAQMMTQVWSMMGDLLTTEGQRRRLRVEIERETTGSDASVTSMDAYRDVLGS